MPETVKFKGSPLHLEGTEVKVGDEAPDFVVRKSLTETVKLSDYRGKTIVLSVVPSLDTGVCDTMARRFNEEAGKLGDDVVVITLSRDLPPAQARWCGASGADKLVLLSDYHEREAGRRLGLAIKELGLLARAVFVIDPKGTVKYAEYVPEITEQPDYGAAIKAAKS